MPAPTLLGQVGRYDPEGARIRTGTVVSVTPDAVLVDVAGGTIAAGVVAGAEPSPGQVVSVLVQGQTAVIMGEPAGSAAVAAAGLMAVSYAVNPGAFGTTAGTAESAPGGWGTGGVSATHRFEPGRFYVLRWLCCVSDNSAAGGAVSLTVRLRAGTTTAGRELLRHRAVVASGTQTHLPTWGWVYNNSAAPVETVITPTIQRTSGASTSALYATTTGPDRMHLAQVDEGAVGSYPAVLVAGASVV